MNTETKTSTLAALRPAAPAPVDSLPSVGVGFGNLQSFELIQRVGSMFSKSTLVPKEYAGNVGNCVIAVNMAARVGADPLMVMQNLVIVHGRPTWSSQFLIATVNTCGRFSALRFEFFGEPGTDGWGCRAWAIEKATGEKLVGTDVTIKIAKDEGWYGKNGSKWKTIPQQMLMYRAGSWWTRAYAPELSMGLHTEDEMRDVYDARQDVEGNFSVELDSLRQTPHIAADDGIVDVTTSAQTAEPTNAAEHDPETGEIVDKQAERPVFRLEDHNLSTQTGAKAASKALINYLRTLDEDERHEALMEVGGHAVLDVLGKFGLGLEKRHYDALGITV